MDKLLAGRRAVEVLTRLAAAGGNGARLADLYEVPPVWAVRAAERLLELGLVARDRVGVYTVTPAGTARLGRRGRRLKSTEVDRIVPVGDDDDRSGWPSFEVGRPG